MPFGYSGLPFAEAARKAFRRLTRYAFVLPPTLDSTLLNVLMYRLVSAGVVVDALAASRSNYRGSCSVLLACPSRRTHGMGL
jgi:hypothetical protein